MTALARAINDPQPVDGIGTRSPVDGLDRRSVGFFDVLAQSVSAVAPSAAATTIPLLVAVVAGGATVWSLATAMLLAFLVATTINQFTRRIAAAGSIYTFVSRGLGTTAAFVAGVGLLVGYGFISMFALGGAGYYLTIVVGRFWPALTGSVFVAGLLIVVMAALCLLVLARGIRLSTRITLLVEAVSVLIIVVLVVALLVRLWPVLDWSQLAPGGIDPANFAVGSALALTAFVGFESASTLGVEAKRPYASIPRAIVFTVLGSGVLYLLASFSQLVGFSALGGTIAASASPVNDLAAAYGIDAVGLLLDVSIATSFLACAIASTTALVRVLFSMGREGLLPSRFGRTHPRYRTPFDAALVAMSVITAVLLTTIALSGSIWQTMEVLIVGAAGGYMTAYLLVCVAAPVFLRRIGESTFWPVLFALLAAVLLGAVLVTYLVVESGSARALGVWVFLGVMALGLAWCGLRLRSRPWLRDTIGVYDVPVTGDLLGGPAPADAAARGSGRTGP
ncbi:APC family permease [Cryobacterium sp. RTS3]|uniref:APC family permease n=1 Tax=Cryobacterium sp. RTS3 TaxID=3048643 RepID=UPI002B239317|nr:APC family permease [Cryobacterium sp. RTS3]MEB0000012.1 APC family permease [Cryobacterium sp. RTS3]